MIYEYVLDLPSTFKAGEKKLLCDGKLEWVVHENTGFSLRCSIKPTSLFTKEDWESNKHFRKYFSKEEVQKNGRKRRAVAKTSKTSKKPTKSTKLSQKRKPASKVALPKTQQPFSFEED